MRVIIASSYLNIRDALRAYLTTDPSIDIVAEAVSPDETVEAAAAHQPDVVLIENAANFVVIHDMTEQLANAASDTSVVYLGISPNNRTRGTTADACCSEFLPLELAPRDLFDVVWSATLRRRGHGADFSAACSPMTSPSPSSVSRELQPLSRGEAYLMQRMAGGETPDALSAALGLPAASLEAYRRRIMTRLSGSTAATFAAAAASRIPA